jgi:predicted RNA-binding protein with RPS1 domain
MTLQVFVKVISIESSSGKLSLSIKYVNQTTGQDLDENGVELDRENQRRKVSFLVSASFLSLNIPFRKRPGDRKNLLRWVRF